MSALAVPAQQQTSGKKMTRSGSASPLRGSTVEHEDDLVPFSRSRRNSESNAASGATTNNPTNSAATAAPANASSAPASASSAPSAGAPGSAAAQAGLVPLPQGPMQASAENAALTSHIDWSEPDQIAAHDGKSAVTSIYIGKNKKPFHVHNSQLMEKSPYFKKLLGGDSGQAGQPATMEQTSFEDVDEFAMGLFMHWLNDHGHLNGPYDFHSLAHYLGLYVLAKKFEIEGLENQVMDLVRHYYAEQNMTAPAYRLEYIYTYTHTPNHMRTFLVSTAAFRYLEETPHADLAAANPMLHKTFYAPGSHVSDSIKAVLAKNPEMAVDFIEELVSLHRDGEADARHGTDCKWHSHEQTTKCKTERREPWQSDGPADEKPEAKPAAPGGPSAPVDPKNPEPAKPAVVAVVAKPSDPAKPEPPKPAVAAVVAKPSDPAKPAVVAVAPKAAEPPKPAEPAKPTAPKPAEHHDDAKSDNGPFKKFGGKMKDMLHKKDASKPTGSAADKPAAPPAPPAAPKK